MTDVVIATTGADTSKLSTEEKKVVESIEEKYLEAPVDL